MSGTFAGEVDGGSATCGVFLGGIVNSGSVTAQSALGPTVNGGTLTVSGMVTNPTLNGGTVTAQSVSGGFAVGEVGGGTLIDSGGLTLQPGWSIDVEESGFAVVNGSVIVSSAAVTVGVDPGGGELDLNGALTIAGTVNDTSPFNPYLTQIRDGDIDNGGTGGVLNVSGTITVNLSTETEDSGIVVDGPQAQATFSGAVQLGESSSGFGNFEVDAGQAQVIAGGVALEVGAATVFISGTVSSSGQFTVNGDTVIGDRGGQVGDLEIVGSGGSALFSGDVDLSENDGTGTLTVSSGGLAEITGTLTIGDTDGDAPSLVTIDGTDSTLTVTGDAIVGDAGLGGVQIQNSGTLSVGSLDIAAQESSGSTADDTPSLVSVDGDQSTLTVDGALTVGDAGYGALTIADGATTSLGGDLDIAEQSTSGDVVDEAPSFVIVDGTGSTMTVAGETTVAVAGDAQLQISNGGLFKTGGDNLVIAALAGGTGVLLMDGAGSTLQFSGHIVVGAGGDGTFELSDKAAYTVSGDLVLGSDAESLGTLDLESNAALTIDGDLDLGQTGGGALQIHGGATLVVNGALDGAVDQGSTATADIADAGVTVTIHGNLIVGDAGAMTMTIGGGITVAVTDAITVGNQATGNGTLTLTGTDTTLQAGADDVTIANQGIGVLNIFAGATLAADANAVTIGAANGSNGTVTVSGDDSTLDADDLTVGADGTALLSMDTGGAVAVGGDLLIGDGDTGDGTVTIADAQSSLDVSGTLTVGGSGTGVFTDDGDLSVDGAITIAAQSGSNGTMTFDGTTFSSTESVTIGGAGNGLMIVQQGASAKFDAITIGESDGATGELDDDGATVTSNDITVGSSGGGTLKLTDSATLNTNSDATIGEFVAGQVQTATIDSKSIWAINGDLTIGAGGIATATIQDEGQVGVTGNVILGDQDGASGILTATGAAQPQASNLAYGATLTVGNGGDGTLNIEAGAYVAPGHAGAGVIEVAAAHTGSGTVVVDGSGSMLEGTTLAVGGTQTQAGGTGTVTISNGGLVSVSAVTVWGGSSIDLQSGTLTTDPLTVGAGAAVSGTGTINGAVTNDGTITATGGTLDLTGDVSGAGTLAASGGGDLDVASAYTGAAQIDGDSTIEFASTYVGAATFSGSSTGSGGTLKLDAGSTGPITVVNSNDKVIAQPGNGSWIQAAVNYTLPTNIGTLFMFGTEGIGNSDLSGDALYAVNPSITQTLVGNSLNDAFVVYNTSDIVTPKAGSHDVVYAAASYTLPTGVDSLIMEAGARGTGNSDAAGDALYAASTTQAMTLTGNSANDVFVVYDSADVVVPKAGSHDVVYSAVNYNLPTGVDVLILEGSATQGTGNSDASGDALYGANPVIAVTLTGHSHNDTFVVYNSADTVIGQSGSTDTVYAAANFTLPTVVDTLFLEGTASEGAGNSDSADALFGNAGVASTLIAGSGTDILSVTGIAGTTLIGGAGHDTFAFPNAMGLDTVTNFGIARDTLNFNATLFVNFAAAMTAAGQVGANTVFTIDATDEVTLDNVTKTSLTASNFHFT